MMSDSLRIVSVGLLVFLKDERVSVKEEEGEWVLRIEKVVEEDEGKYECQVSHKEGMDATIFKLVVVTESDNAQYKAMNDDPVPGKPKIVKNKQFLSLERLQEKSIKTRKSKPDSSIYDDKLLVPLVSLVTISTVVTILGTVRTCLSKKSDLTRTSAGQSRTSLHRNRRNSKRTAEQSGKVKQELQSCST